MKSAGFGSILAAAICLIACGPVTKAPTAGRPAAFESTSYRQSDGRAQLVFEGGRVRIASGSNAGLATSAPLIDTPSFNDAVMDCSNGTVACVETQYFALLIPQSGDLRAGESFGSGEWTARVTECVGQTGQCFEGTLVSYNTRTSCSLGTRELIEDEPCTLNAAYRFSPERGITSIVLFASSDPEEGKREQFSLVGEVGLFARE